MIVYCSTIERVTSSDQNLITAPWWPYPVPSVKRIGNPDAKGQSNIFNYILITIRLVGSADRIPTSATIFNFNCVNCLEKTKINEKRPGMAHFFKKVYQVIRLKSD